MTWFKLSEKYPNISPVLGFDNYMGKEDRFAVCDSDERWINIECMDGKKRTFLYVQNSICPGLSDDSNAYWMYLPEKNDKTVWNDFHIDKNPFYRNKLTEVLIQLHNGNFYVGFIESYDWCPSFNMFKHGNLESIKKWMPLPKPPKLI